MANGIVIPQVKSKAGGPSINTRLPPTAADFGGGTAREQEKFGNIAVNAVERVDKARQKALDEDSIRNARQAITAFEKRKREQLMYGENGIYTLKGQDAVNRNDTFADEVESLRQSIRKELKTQKALDEFDRVSNFEVQRDLDYVARYIQRERSSADAATSAARAQEAKNEAFSVVSTPGLDADQITTELRKSEAIVSNEIIEAGEAQGAAPEVINSQIQKELDDLYVGLIDQAIKNKRTQLAEQLYNSVAYKASPQAKAVLDGRMTVNRQLGVAQDFVDNLEGTTTEQLKAIQGIEDPEQRQLTESLWRDRKNVEEKVDKERITNSFNTLLGSLQDNEYNYAEAVRSNPAEFAYLKEKNPGMIEDLQRVAATKRDGALFSKTSTGNLLKFQSMTAEEITQVDLSNPAVKALFTEEEYDIARNVQKGAFEELREGEEELTVKPSETKRIHQFMKDYIGEKHDLYKGDEDAIAMKKMVDRWIIGEATRYMSENGNKPLTDDQMQQIALDGSRQFSLDYGYNLIERQFARDGVLGAEARFLDQKDLNRIRIPEDQLTRKEINQFSDELEGLGFSAEENIERYGALRILKNEGLLEKEFGADLDGQPIPGRKFWTPGDDDLSGGPENDYLSTRSQILSSLHQDATVKFDVKKKTGNNFLDTISEMFVNNTIDMTGVTMNSVEEARNHPITLFEGWENKAYDSIEGGTPTIGVGHKLTSQEVKTGKIKIGGQKVAWENGLTDDQVLALFQQDYAWATSAVDRNVVVPLTEGQKTALASFVFNVGETRFKRSTLLRKLNNGDYDAVVEELRRWVYAGGDKSSGLTNRREKEINIFKS